jgi:hypothetical protein
MTITGSVLVGVVLWNILDTPQTNSTIHDMHKQHHSSGKRQPMSIEEARLRAMIENAKDSTWRENLDNAVSAHNNFMLPGRGNQMEPEFLRNIDERSTRILKENQDQINKENKRKATVTRFWS